MGEGWRRGVAELQRAVEMASPARRDEARADLRFTRAAGINFQSVDNQTRFVLASDAIASGSATLSREQRHRLRAEINQVLESEIVLARQLFMLTQEDSPTGFEP